MQRSKIETELPEEVRAELDRQLIARGFGDYRELSALLAEQGFAISKSSLQRYGSKVEANIARIKASTKMAKLLVDEVGDDEGVQIEAMLRLLQQTFFELLMDLEITPEDIEDPLKVARALSDLARASQSQKKLMQQVRKEDAEKLAQLKRKSTNKDEIALIEHIEQQVYGMPSKSRSAASAEVQP